MIIIVIFFVVSCVLSLTSEKVAEAKADNLTILSYLANHFKTPMPEIHRAIYCIHRPFQFSFARCISALKRNLLD